MTDEIVYITRNNTGGRKSVYHTDEECKALQQANAFYEVTLKALAGHYEPCKICQGNVDHDMNPDKSHHHALIRADPSEVGR